MGQSNGKKLGQLPAGKGSPRFELLTQADVSSSEGEKASKSSSDKDRSSKNDAVNCSSSASARSESRPRSSSGDSRECRAERKVQVSSDAVAASTQRSRRDPRFQL